MGYRIYLTDGTTLDGEDEPPTVMPSGALYVENYQITTFYAPHAWQRVIVQ